MIDKTFSLTKNKSLEFCFYSLKQTNYLTTNIIEYNFDWSRKTDHAGIHFKFAIYKLFDLEITLCDNRHWDDENNCWEEYTKNQIDND
jgi:hypothetical protein